MLTKWIVLHFVLCYYTALCFKFVRVSLFKGFLLTNKNWAILWKRLWVVLIYWAFNGFWQQQPRKTIAWFLSIFCINLLILKLYVKITTLLATLKIAVVISLHYRGKDGFNIWLSCIFCDAVSLFYFIWCIKCGLTVFSIWLCIWKREIQFFYCHSKSDMRQ